MPGAGDYSTGESTLPLSPNPIQSNSIQARAVPCLALLCLALPVLCRRIYQFEEGANKHPGLLSKLDVGPPSLHDPRPIHPSIPFLSRPPTSSQLPPNLALPRRCLAVNPPTAAPVHARLGHRDPIVAFWLPPIPLYQPSLSRCLQLTIQFQPARAPLSGFHKGGARHFPAAARTRCNLDLSASVLLGGST